MSQAQLARQWGISDRGAGMRAAKAIEAGMVENVGYAKEWVQFRFPKSLAALYYLMRPCRFVGEYAFGLEKLKG